MAANTRSLSFAPIPSAYIQAPERHKFIVGPVGSQKTFSSIILILLLATQQRKAPDGIRYTRFAVCRQTLQQAKGTVLKDMMEVYKGFYRWKVSDSTLYITAPDISCEVIFYPLDTPEDQKRLLSTQLTAVLFNEFVEIDPELVTAAFGRCGRYPPKTLGGPSWSGVFGDSNPGTTDSPWYELLVEKLPEGWAYFQQDDPFEKVPDPDNPDQTIMRVRPDADNLENLIDNYYEDQLAGANPAWAERYLHGRWGASLAGQAVFKSTFVPTFHISQSELTPSPGRVLLIGIDTGRHPAAIFTQIDARGRLLVLGEALPYRHDNEKDQGNMGIEKFLAEFVRPMLHQERYADCPAVIVLDPAAVQRSQIGEESVRDAVKRLGFAAEIATTNAIEPRLRAVEKWLLRQQGGGAAMLVDLIHCPRLIKALRGGYHYKISPRTKEKSETPEKNHPDSDLADALEYACLGTAKQILGKIMSRMNRTPETPPPAEAWT